MEGKVRVIGGPAAIRTRVTGSANQCDIQATLWGLIATDLNSQYKRNGLKNWPIQGFIIIPRVDNSWPLLLRGELIIQ